MTLLVEDGSGVAGAVTYADIPAVDAYHEARGNTAWNEAEDTVKSAAILRAMNWLEAQSWIGLPVNLVGSKAGQSLQWPRIGVVLNGYDWPSDEIPPGVTNALCEAALIEVTEAGALAPELERGGRVQTEKVDVLSTTYADNAPAGTVYRALQQALAGLVMSTNTVRLVR